MKCLFLGNRKLVRRVCQELFYTKVVDTPKGCDRDKLFRLIQQENYDILVSNGCPWILPMDIKKGIWVNVHPSYLPEYKGTSPIKEMFRDKVGYYAATCHYIDEGVDTGDIIYQEKVEAKYFNLNQIYSKSFSLEAKVFRKAMELIYEKG